MNRIFVVGCPRSGTTLVHSLLGAHPDVFTLPETFFFARVVPRNRWWRRSGFASRRSAMAWERLAAAGVPPPSAPMLTVGQHARAFTRALDAAAQVSSATAWVEKTPVHLHYVREIERAVPGARFVHVVRSGADVVASLHAVTHANPDAWGGARSLEACARRWADDVARSHACAGRDGHAFVSHEELTADAAAASGRLCEAVGLDRSDASVTAMLCGYRAVGAKVSLGAPWKARVSTTITAAAPPTSARGDVGENVERLVSTATRTCTELPFL